MYVPSQKLDNDIEEFYANEDETPSLLEEIKKPSAYNGTLFGYKLGTKIKDHLMQSDQDIYGANLTLEKSGILIKTGFFKLIFLNLSQMKTNLPISLFII